MAGGEERKNVDKNKKAQQRRWQGQWWRWFFKKDPQKQGGFHSLTSIVTHEAQDCRDCL
jgi:hypothetical protein